METSRMRAAAGALFVALSFLPGAPAFADPAPTPTFEVSPFAGYQFGGSFLQSESDQHLRLDDHQTFAIALDARADASSQYELFYDRQSTALAGGGSAPLNVTVEYLHIGGTVTLDDSSQLKPYLAGGLGISRLDPDRPETHEDTAFSVSLALGVRLPVSQHFSLRAEARGFLTIVDSNSALFCHSGQDGAACQITAQGSTLFQVALLAGISYSF